jgi:hypothetical protein
MADDWKTKVLVLRFIAAIAHEAHQILGLLESRYSERREGTRRGATKSVDLEQARTFAPGLKEERNV